ncbi:MAG: hypothetical protein PUI99_11165 [Clostridiales bacterium]|nr:hypothetical protein [Clostridiales bacterium]
MSRGEHLPYAVPAVGMRKRRKCPVCGEPFMAAPEHRWIAYMPKTCDERPVCSYSCMREMERRIGRYTAKEAAVTEAQEEQAQTQGGDAVCTEADELFALLQQKELLERQLKPVSWMVEQIYEQKRVKKTGAQQKKELFDREKQLMRRLGEVNRRIREVKNHV